MVSSLRMPSEKTKSIFSCSLGAGPNLISSHTIPSEKRWTTPLLFAMQFLDASDVVVSDIFIGLFLKHNTSPYLPFVSWQSWLIGNGREKSKIPLRCSF